MVSPRVEVVELQRLAVAVVEGVLAEAGMRDDDQPVALERPWDRASQADGILEERQRTLQQRPDAHLVELERVDGALVDRLPFLPRKACDSSFHIAGGSSAPVSAL